jgi:4-amino-4-deoxy-L-arabinose transferase-like glycosyltransferase
MLKLIIWLLILKMGVLVGLHVADIGLFPDEAQYWTWSQELSGGYYSKPAGIAWEIAGGTALFGDTELGVRFGAFVLSFLLALSIWFLARSAGLGEKCAFWSALALAFTPMGFLASFLATTDCGFLLFWTLASALFAKPLLEGKPLSYIDVGLLIGCGALFKWAAFLLWVPIFIFALVRREVTLRFFYALFLSLLALIPSLIWCHEHEWATILHVTRSIVPQAAARGTPNPGDFFLAQFGIASPIFFFFILIATLSFAVKLRKLPLSISFLWTSWVFVFGVVLALACFKKVQANWAVAGYPAAFVMLFSWAQMQKPAIFRCVQAGLFVSVGLVAVAFSATNELPYKMNFFREGLGWHSLERGLERIGYNPKTQFLFSDRYQTTSILSFYSPEKKRAYFMNFHALRKNQFSFWPSMAEKERGKSGYYVAIIDGKDAMQKAVDFHVYMKKILADYFQEVAVPLVIIPLYEVNHEVLKLALCIRCENYNGKMPRESGKY